MSPDDIAAEKRMMDAVEVLTGHPLLGLTCGSDGYWSARFWGESFDTKKISWCASVRVLSETLEVYFNDRIIPPPRYQEMFKRTETVWGPLHHARLARLRIGIVGLGSVGSLVAETLARMGMTRVCLIDFDEVQRHNLDRLLGATKADIGRLKIEVAARQMAGSATAETIDIRQVPFSIAEEAGYQAALDCDVIFSCVDRPRARAILNHLAYAHLIPVIDGGIQVRFKKGVFSGADWQLQTVCPGRPCLECLGAFTASDVETEKAGMLEDPKYMDSLPADHRFKNNENVFPFSSNLASLEVFQLIALVTGAGRVTDFGVQRFRYMPGHLESDTGRKCHPSCYCDYLTARGDKDFKLAGTDLGAAKARERQRT
jgi:molybdopterin/thiamine biosynthesis adenylyltransferase